MAAHRQAAQEALDDAVLQRVEADGRQPRARRGPGRRRRQALFDLSQFVVHSYPQGLKGAGGRVDPAVPSANRAAHDLRQLPGAGDRRALARLDHRAGDPAALALIAVPPEDVRQGLGIQTVDQVRGRRTGAAVHAHVQRTCRPEAEAPLGAVELQGTGPEVEQDDRGLAPADLRQDFGDLAEARLAQGHARAEFSQPLAGQRQSFCVPVQADEPPAKS